VNGPVKVLLVEDRREDAELLLREIKKNGLDVTAQRVDSEPALAAALAGFGPDLILSDYSLPGFSGMRALEMAHAWCAEIPFIFISGTIGEERAIEALKNGATDYVLKDRRARLVPAIRLALREAEARAARKHMEEELAASEQRFHDFMQHLAGAAYLKDLDGRFIFVNDGVARMAGRPAQDCLGHTAAELFPAQYAAEFEHDDDAALHSDTPIERIEHVPLEDGVHAFLTHKFPILGAGRQPVAIGGIGLDVTERIQQQEKIARLNRMHEVLSGINSASIRIRNRPELLRAACRIAVEQGGFCLAWAATSTQAGQVPDLVALASAGDAALHEQIAQTSVLHHDHPAMQALRSRGTQVHNHIAPEAEWAASCGQDGTPAYRSLAALPLLVKGCASGVLVFCAAEAGFFDHAEARLLEELAADVSFALEYLDAEEKLSQAAYYDPLTGLPNGRLFFDRLRQMIEAARPTHECVGVAVVDLRRFRNVNETLGRDAGDRYLADFAARMQALFPKQATVARVGGDRFAVAIGNARGAHLARLIEACIRRANTQPLVVQDVEVRVAFKVGVALFPNDGGDAETLFRNVEAAVRRAKDTAAAYMFYAPDMNSRVAESLLLESRLQAACEHKGFQVHYQPKVDLKTRRVLGLEALLRWPDKERGFTSPAVFVPLLEQNGMIVEVGDWVMQQVAADMLAWQEEGLEVPPVAVNVSQLQLLQADFISRMTALLDAVNSKGQAPLHMDIEVTESLIMEDAAATIAKLRQLRALGIRIHMDDFGTGYSSLSQIAKLPLDALKIDRAFTLDMNDKIESRAIVSTIISLAHALGIAVIAEGVENEEQAATLAALGCGQAQGYLFSPAITAAAIAGQLPRAAVAA
jgi:diguanylate cyclase (GGDEF)-like protein/PAS domain S-box-containing protein